MKSQPESGPDSFLFAIFARKRHTKSRPENVPTSLLRYRRGLRSACLCTLHSTPYTLHPTPYTLHTTFFTLHTPFTLHPTPYTLHPTPYTLHPTPYTLHPTPCTLHPAPYTLHTTHRSPIVEGTLGMLTGHNPGSTACTYYEVVPIHAGYGCRGHGGRGHGGLAGMAAGGKPSLTSLPLFLSFSLSLSLPSLSLPLSLSTLMAGHASQPRWAAAPGAHQQRPPPPAPRCSTPCAKLSRPRCARSTWDHPRG